MSQDELGVLGAAIEKARKDRGLTQQALAAAVRMSRATISGIENGTVREIGIRKILNICGTLGLELIVRPQRARPTLDELRRERHDKATSA